MDPRGDHNALPLPDLFSIIGGTLRSKGSDNQHVDIVASESLAQHFPPEAQLLPRVSLQPIQVPTQIRVGVRVAVCKIHDIVLMLELYTKSQGVIVALSFAFHRILVVAHIFSVAIPTFTELFCLNV